jgi:hypothetical protein
MVVIVVAAAQKGGGGSRYNLPRTVTVTPAAMFMFLVPPFVWMIFSVFKCSQPHRNRLVKSR